MTLHGPTSLVHWLAGFDLAGRGAITEIDDMVESATQDVTPLGPMGAIKHDAPLGRVTYTLSESGHLRARQLSLRRLFASGTPATPWPSIVGHLGGSMGAAVDLATDMRMGKRSLVPDTGGITKVAIEYYLAQGGELHEGAVLLAHGVVEDVRDIGSTPAAAYRLDNGASSDGGATICLMVDADGTRWRGYPALTLQVRHSVNSGGPYANLGSSFVLNRDDKGSTVIEIASGTTVRRHLALRFTFSGTRDSFNLDGNHSSGDTTLSVDGGSGTERIEAGDHLRIAGDTYTVLTAARGSGAGDWDVVLTAGLTANVVNNQLVVLTDENVSLRYAAAIERR